MGGGCNLSAYRRLRENTRCLCSLSLAERALERREERKRHNDVAGAAVKIKIKINIKIKITPTTRCST